MAAVVLIFSTLLCFIIGSLECYQLKDIIIPDAHKQKMFKDEDIAKYDGSDPDLPIYMAVRGVVFDVTSGKSFYGKGAGYNALAGKDATRAVAKMSLEAEDFIPDTSGLLDDQLEALDKIYEQVYVQKYSVVGYMEYLLEAKVEKHGGGSLKHNLKDDL